MRLCCGRHQKRSARLGPTGQVVEVFIGTISVKIVRAFGFRRRKYQRKSTLKPCGQLFAAGVVVRGRLAIKSTCRHEAKHAAEEGTGNFSLHMGWLFSRDRFRRREECVNVALVHERRSSIYEG